MKEYVKPLLEEQKVQIQDVIAESGEYGFNQPGDVQNDWPVPWN